MVLSIREDVWFLEIEGKKLLLSISSLQKSTLVPVADEAVTKSIRVWRDFRRGAADHQLLRKAAHDTPQLTILIELFCMEDKELPMTASDFCQDTGISMATTLRHLSKLEMIGAIKRNRCTKDTRRVFISLTDRWRAAISGLYTASIRS